MSNLGDPGTFSTKIVRSIGTGGLGTVDEVEVTHSYQSYPVGTRLARKRLNEKFREHPDARARFEREIKAVKTLSAHANIVTYKGENLADSAERYYFMPVYVRSLRDLVNANPKGFGWVDVARFGVTMADAMQRAHSRGFKHRDLKPENILQDNLNNPVIADWGLGYFIHKESKVLLTKAGMGTEYYCSFEQWATGKCDFNGDVYSLGMVLAELTTGQRHTIRAGQGIQVDVVANSSYGAQHFNLIINQMTRPKPEERWQNMSGVSQALANAASWAEIRAAGI